MVRTLFIRVSADPRKSARAAEAVRIGAGVGAWKKVQVHVLFEGPSVRALDEFADELVSGELFTQYLPSIAEHGGRITVEKDNPLLRKIKPVLAAEELTRDQIEQLAKAVDHVMRFADA